MFISELCHKSRTRKRLLDRRGMIVSTIMAPMIMILGLTTIYSILTFSSAVTLDSMLGLMAVLAVIKGFYRALK